MKKVLLKYNNLTHLDPDYQHRVMDLGDFYQQLPYDTDFKVYHVTDLDFAVSQLDYDTDWVVVVAAGHCTQDRNLYDKLIVEALKENSPLIGHILNFKDQYPHIHPQLFAFDYRAWSAASREIWEYDGRESTFLSPKVLASDETFHDEYTPHWITVKPGEYEMRSVKEMQVGAWPIKCFLDVGMKIVNIPEHLRKNKFHLYPDQEWAAFNNFLHGNPYTGTVYEQKNYAELIEHLGKQAPKQYYVLNTEPLERPQVSEKIDHYIGVAAGLKIVATMIKNGFDEDTCVTYFDFSEYGLELQRFIHEYWDGDINTYEQVCNDFAFLVPDAYICRPRGTYIENLEYLLDQCDYTAEEFKLHWARYKEIKIARRKINLYDKEDQEQLADMCIPFSTNYLWISNAFWMEYSLVKFGKTALEDLRNNLIAELKNIDSKIILDVEDTWHQGLITINN